jgi:uncharacterized repeat protein (TIGR04138 family)
MGAMPETIHPLIRLLKEDRRYKFEAYQFVREALTYAQEVMQLGVPAPSAEPPRRKKAAQKGPATEGEEPAVERHLTGQQLCEAVRRYALEQYGYMARTVLANWGIRSTSDVGEVVYNLIRIGLMKKSSTDRREDFDDVYDFDRAFVHEVQITRPE